MRNVLWLLCGLVYTCSEEPASPDAPPSAEVREAGVARMDASVFGKPEGSDESAVPDARTPIPDRA